MQSNPTAAWDDITGAPLDPARVMEARRLEIEYADRKPVWRKISRKTAKSQGWKIARSRWIDTNKADEEDPEYRSRLGP